MRPYSEGGEEVLDRDKAELAADQVTPRGLSERLEVGLVAVSLGPAGEAVTVVTTVLDMDASEGGGLEAGEVKGDDSGEERGV